METWRHASKRRPLNKRCKRVLTRFMFPPKEYTRMPTAESPRRANPDAINKAGFRPSAEGSLLYAYRMRAACRPQVRNHDNHGRRQTAATCRKRAHKLPMGLSRTTFKGNRKYRPAIHRPAIRCAAILEKWHHVLCSTKALQEALIRTWPLRRSLAGP